LVKIGHKILGTLHDDPNEVVSFLPATLNRHKSVFFEKNGIRLLG